MDNVWTTTNTLADLMPTSGDNTLKVDKLWYTSQLVTSRSPLVL